MSDVTHLWLLWRVLQCFVTKMWRHICDVKFSSQNVTFQGRCDAARVRIVFSSTSKNVTNFLELGTNVTIFSQCHIIFLCSAWKIKKRNLRHVWNWATVQDSRTCTYIAKSQDTKPRFTWLYWSLCYMMCVWLCLACRRQVHCWWVEEVWHVFVVCVLVYVTCGMCVFGMCSSTHQPWTCLRHSLYTWANN